MSIIKPLLDYPIQLKPEEISMGCLFPAKRTQTLGISIHIQRPINQV